jgi:hypothetical protein
MQTKAPMMAAAQSKRDTQKYMPTSNPLRLVIATPNSRIAKSRSAFRLKEFKHQILLPNNTHHFISAKPPTPFNNSKVFCFFLLCFFVLSVVFYFFIFRKEDWNYE